MEDLKGFTKMILSDISRRLGGSSTGSQVRMQSLESLTKVRKKESILDVPQKAAAADRLINVKAKKLFSESDIAGMEANGELRLSQGDIITPLAMDMIRSKKIRIKRET